MVLVLTSCGLLCHLDAMFQAMTRRWRNMSYRFGEFSTIKISYLLPAYSASLHHFQVSKDHRNLVIHVSHRVQLKPMKMALLGMRRTPCVSTLVKIPSCSLRLQYNSRLLARRLVFFLFVCFSSFLANRIFLLLLEALYHTTRFLVVVLPFNE